MDRKYLKENVNVTPHFTLYELTFKDGERYVEPPVDARINLGLLCVYHLEELRNFFGPIKINSGYRDEDKNLQVGGSKNSYHLHGLACDFHCPSLRFAIRFASYLLVNNDYLESQYQIAELIIHKNPVYIHLAMRAGISDNKFYLDIK